MVILKLVFQGCPWAPPSLLILFRNEFTLDSSPL